MWCLALSPCFESHLKSLHHIHSVCCMLLFTVPARFKERWGMSLRVGRCQSQGAEEYAGRRRWCCRHWKMLPAPTCQSSNAVPLLLQMIKWRPRKAEYHCHGHKLMGAIELSLTPGNLSMDLCIQLL